MKHLLIFFFLSVPFFIVAQPSNSLQTLFEKIEAYEINTDPLHELWKGSHPSKVEELSLSEFKQQEKKYNFFIKQLHAISDAELNHQEKISKSIMLMKLKDQASLIKYRIHLIPFNAEGGFHNEATFFLPNLPYNSEEDYIAYLQWLPSYASYLGSYQPLMEQGISEGVIAPKIVVKNMITSLENWTNEDFLRHPFYRPLLHMPEEIPQERQRSLAAQGQKIIKQSIIAAYKGIHDFMVNKYLPEAPDAVGVSGIKNGRSYYQNRVQHYTTLNLSPDSVYQLGISEVARIRTKMEGIIEELGYEGNFDDFIQYLRADPQFYPATEEELLYFAAWLSKKAEGKLPQFFSNLYELPYTVEPVPLEIAPTYTVGRYVHGSRLKNKPGIYWVNTHNLSSRPLYNMPALTLHEAVPGHHLQTTRAAELEDIPVFRKSYYISAYGEGWGLYAEYLGEEMGMYSTLYEQFGRYTYEMWRAVRLVVDVGMHYKGWSREKAIEFMAANTALSMHEVNTEIDRYIGWPGQALSYKIGEITIKELRGKAETTLGNSFDIQEFHEVILRNGSVPLPVLIREVEQYIESKK